MCRKNQPAEPLYTYAQPTLFEQCFLRISTAMRIGNFNYFSIVITIFPVLYVF